MTAEELLKNKKTCGKSDLELYKTGILLQKRYKI